MCITRSISKGVLHPSLTRGCQPAPALLYRVCSCSPACPALLAPLRSGVASWALSLCEALSLGCFVAITMSHCKRGRCQGGHSLPSWMVGEHQGREASQPRGHRSLCYAWEGRG